MIYWSRKLRRLRNTLRHTPKGKPLTLLAIAVFILGAMTWGSLQMFGALARIGDFPDFFRLFMAEKILFMVSMILFAMIVLSSMIATLGQFFLAPDIPLLLASPLPHGRLFLWKTMDTLLSSTAMAVLFFLPVLTGYAVHFGHGSGGLAAMILAFGLFLLTAALSGIVLGMVVPLFISIRRLQPALSLLGVLLISGVVVILRLAQPERFFRPGAIKDLMTYIQGFEIKGMSATPFHWFSNAMAAASQGNLGRFALYACLLAGATLIMMAALTLIRKRLYLTLLDKIHFSRRSRPRNRRRQPARSILRALLRKETLTFRRSPDQWSQLFIIVAITIVFILNIRSIPNDQGGMGILTAFLNMGMTAFIIAGLNSRFAFPAMPLEGAGLVHVLASPAPRDALLTAKMLAYIPPQVALGLGIYLSGYWLLKLDAFMLWTGLVYLIPALIFLSLLAFRYGLEVLPGANETAENLLLSRSGITFMLISLGFIVLSLALFAYPIATYYLHRFHDQPPPWVAIAACYGGYALFSGLFCRQTLRKCRRLWRRRGD